MSLLTLLLRSFSCNERGVIFLACTRLAIATCRNTLESRNIASPRLCWPEARKPLDRVAAFQVSLLTARHAQVRAGGCNERTGKSIPCLVSIVSDVKRPFCVIWLSGGSHIARYD